MSYQEPTKEEIQGIIEEYGCYIAHFEADNYLPSFAYTIGLQQRFNHPEIICFGLKDGQLGGLLNTACDGIKNGQVFQPDTSYDNIMTGYPAMFLQVDHSYYADYWGYANWFYDHQPFAALQLIWPDSNHHYPWEPGFNPSLKFKQPLLDRNTDFKFYEERKRSVFTSSQVLRGAPVLYVYHDEDGDWQFHSEANPLPEDARTISMDIITWRDPSINRLYHLPLGAHAWRASIEDKWQWTDAH